MCGRGVLSSPIQRIIAGFAVREWFEPAAGPRLSPRYNIAPTDPMLALRIAGGRRRLDSMTWGFWREGLGKPVFNARSDQLDGAMWREPFRRRRCLVIMDGFYEWPKGGAPGDRQARYVFLKSGEPMAMAGLYETNARDGLACTVCTCEANELVASIPHPRMPVILPREHHDAWLDPDNDNVEALAAMLRPAPAERMSLARVGPYVNRRVDDPRCIEESDGPEQMVLF